MNPVVALPAATADLHERKLAYRRVELGRDQPDDVVEIQEGSVKGPAAHLLADQEVDIRRLARLKCGEDFRREIGVAHEGHVDLGLGLILKAGHDSAQPLVLARVVTLGPSDGEVGGASCDGHDDKSRCQKGKDEFHHGLSPALVKTTPLQLRN